MSNTHVPTIMDDIVMISKRDTDSIVVSVLQQFLERSAIGKQKYGTDLDRTDLSILDWIQHAQEEHMDAILYLEKLKVEWNKKNRQDNSTQTDTTTFESTFLSENRR
jgi:hypothetical protein